MRKYALIGLLLLTLLFFTACGDKAKETTSVDTKNIQANETKTESGSKTENKVESPKQNEAIQPTETIKPVGQTGKEVPEKQETKGTTDDKIVEVPDEQVVDQLLKELDGLETDMNNLDDVSEADLQ